MFGGSGGPFVCMACGTDLWDVPRYLRAGGVTICPACVQVLAARLTTATESGAIDVTVPPRVDGAVPDDRAVDEVVDAFMRTFGGPVANRDDAMEDAAELIGALDHARTHFAANMDPRPRVDRVRFPDADTAEVRFRILLAQQPEGMRHEGRALRRDGRWRVTRATVTSVLPGGGFGLGGRVALQAVAAPPPPPPPPHDD